MRDEWGQHSYGRRRWGCFGTLAGSILLYGLFRVVPAGWYMPRQHQVYVNSFCVSGGVLATLIEQEEYYNDYNSGVVVLLNNGPRRVSSSRDVLAIFSISESLRVTHVRQTVAAGEEKIWGIVSLTNSVSFVKERDDGMGQIGEFVRSGIRYTEFKGVRARAMSVAAPGVVSIVDTNRVCHAYVRERANVGDDEWKHAFDYTGWDGPQCYVPNTVAETVFSYDKKNVLQRRDITLYTLGEDGRVATNFYHSNYSNVVRTTAMGEPDNPLFADCVAWGESYALGLGPKWKVVVWNKTAMVREIDVPWRDIQEGAVALHTSADGRKHIVTLWAMKARRQSVDFRVTFVDLANGEQTVRDVTVPLPPDGR